MGPRGADSYAAFEPQYIDVLADLRAAETIASGRAAIYAGKPSGTAATAIVQLIRNCDADVVATARLHKAGQLTAADFRSSMTKEVCELSSKAEARLKP